MIRAAANSYGMSSGSCRCAGLTAAAVFLLAFLTALTLSPAHRHEPLDIPMRRAERQRRQEGEQKNGGGGQRCDIDRTVLPQFAPHRPVHTPTGGDDRRRGYLQFEGRPGHGV